MTDEGRLAEIRAREQAATPGPWGRYGWPGPDGEIRPLQGAIEAAPGLSIGSVEHTEPIARFSGYLLPVEANADFSAHARQDIPYLLEQLDALRADLDTARTWSARWKSAAKRLKTLEVNLLVGLCRFQETINELLTERDAARAALADAERREADIAPFLIEPVMTLDGLKTLRCRVCKSYWLLWEAQKHLEGCQAIPFLLAAHPAPAAEPVEGA